MPIATFCGAEIRRTNLSPRIAPEKQIVPQGVIASGSGVINGIANTVGALAPFAMGLVISATNNFDAGLMVLVVGAFCCSCAILPLVKRY